MTIFFHKSVPVVPNRNTKCSYLEEKYQVRKDIACSDEIRGIIERGSIFRPYRRKFSLASNCACSFERMALPALLSTDDLVKFRTRFCERFLQFGECNFGGKCQYSHNMTWRRRSPQKYLYEPRLCENILSFVGDNGAKRQSLVNCHNGKSCKFAHSREEILYHPLVYKTVMCEDMSCCRYYCPFGHAMEELLPASEAPEYIRRCLIEAASLDETWDSDLLDEDMMVAADSEVVEGGGMRLRKASSGGGQLLSSSSSSVSPSCSLPQSLYRVHLPVPGSSDWNISDQSAWISITPTIRIETVVRATSPVVPSELCRALVSRTDTAGLAAKKTASHNNVIPSQYCLCKVMQFEESSSCCSQLLSELTNVSKTEHRNLIAIKRVHVGSIGGNSQMLCVAMEQCSTSLYQAIVDGYRNGDNGSVRGLARKLNPHNGTTTITAIQRIGEIISGLQRLHFIGITHLRLHPTNILIDGEASFKLADFVGKSGILKSLSGTSTGSSLSESVQAWLAPELISALKNKGEKIVISNLKACDVFALGLVIMYAMTGQHAFGTFSTTDKQLQFCSGDTKQVMENISSDYISNQHLLYDCPLVLDLVFRCLSFDAADRLEISELSRHPLFWDLDFTRSFFASLPFGDPAFDMFTSYELFWRNHLTEISCFEETNFASSLDQYPDTVAGAVRFLLDIWNKESSTSCYKSVWLKLLDSFPQILIRVWDATKLSQVPPDDRFARNHLHWMSLRGLAVTCISHQFVREYYALISDKNNNKNISLLPDESRGLTDACASHSAGLILAAKRVHKKNMRASPVISESSVISTTPCSFESSVAGMTFVDPLIVKQMAAASAALSAVYDNPDLVMAITKGEVNPVNQLIATATIYSSLLHDAGASPPPSF